MQNKCLPALLNLTGKVLLLSITMTTTGWTACTPAGLPTGANIQASISNGIHLGDIVTPDAGNSASVELRPDGVIQMQTASSLIGATNQTNYGSTPRAGIIHVTGAADCEITVSLVPPSATGINSVQFLLADSPTGSTSLNSITTYLSGAGEANIYVGANISINSAATSNILENSTVNVTCTDTAC